MLENEVVDALRQRLQARAAELRGEIRSVDAEDAAARTVMPRDTVEDSADQGERLRNQAVRDAEKARDAQELDDVAAALQRMDEGRYGDCIDCGVHIDVRRLLAQLAAARCLACQERFERSSGGSLSTR
jgi:DnaK suppressor protein